MALDTAPEPTSFVGQAASGIVYGIGLLSFLGIVISNYFGAKSKKDETKVVSTTIEMVDSGALAKDLRKVLDAGMERDAMLTEISRKMENALDRLRKIEMEAEISRLADERVAAELARERARDGER